MERGFLTKVTQGKIIEILTDFLEKKGVKGLKAKLAVTGASLFIRIGDDVFAEKVNDQELKEKARSVLESILVDGDVDVSELIELALKLIDAFKKE